MRKPNLRGGGGQVEGAWMPQTHRSYRAVLAKLRPQPGAAEPLSTLPPWPPSSERSRALEGRQEPEQAEALHSPGRTGQRDLGPHSPPSASPGKFPQPPAVEPRVQRPLNRIRSHWCSSSLLRESGDKLQISSRENCPRKSENDILGAEGPEGSGSRRKEGVPDGPRTEQGTSSDPVHVPGATVQVPGYCWRLRFIREPSLHVQ